MKSLNNDSFKAINNLICGDLVVYNNFKNKDEKEKIVGKVINETSTHKYHIKIILIELIQSNETQERFIPITLYELFYNYIEIFKVEMKEVPQYTCNQIFDFKSSEDFEKQWLKDCKLLLKQIDHCVNYIHTLENIEPTTPEDTPDDVFSKVNDLKNRLENRLSLSNGLLKEDLKID